MSASENILGYVILFFVFLIIIKCYYDNDYFHLKCVVSDVNGKKYCVRERKNIQNVLNIWLQQIRQHPFANKIKWNIDVDPI